MCGRYAITTAPEAMRSLFRYPDQPNFPPRYNIAPTQPIPVVRLIEGQRRFSLVRWGLTPSWVRDPRAFSLLINARGESVLDKPAFRGDALPQVSRPGGRVLRMAARRRAQAAVFRPPESWGTSWGTHGLCRSVGSLERAEWRGDGN